MAQWLQEGGVTWWSAALRVPSAGDRARRRTGRSAPMSTQDVATDVTGRSVVSGTRADTAPMDRRAMARDRDDEIEVPISKDLNFTRDRVRWGPVLAGLFTALTTMVALALLGAAIGLTAM